MEDKNNNRNENVENSLKWHFFNMYCMALSDTDFDPKEAELLYKIGIEHGLDKKVIDEIVVTSGLHPDVPETMEEKIAYLYDLTRMAWADGKIEDEEKMVLMKNILRFGFKEENKESILMYLIDSVKAEKSLSQIIQELKV